MNHFVLLASAGGKLAQIGSNLSQIATDTGQRFGVDWPHFIAQVVSFLIVAGLLYRFAYHPILEVLDLRRRRIAESLANAEKIKEELANAQARAQDVLDQAGAQATKMIEEARQAAARVQEQETQRAIAAAKDIVEKAREATEVEHARMLADLRREVGRLVVNTTAKVVGKTLTPDDQNRLVAEANQELANN